MRFLREKHRQLTSVATLLFFQMIISVVLLKHSVACIFFIADRFSDTLSAPFTAKRTRHASTVQILANSSEGFSGDNAVKYLANNRCSGGINLNTVLRYTISEQKPPVE
ncbi:hypothetical protein SDC9_94561 [bioreactor metagenome]|uniref:Uncharacterized protein n=1 Tax=bioreactor metagenome TaxID=1076179 RepID=A0A645A3S6_9ZZZZ